MKLSSGYPPRPDSPPAPPWPPSRTAKVASALSYTVDGFKALPGNKVLLAGEFPAHVDYICVYPNGRKRYSVVWWHEGSRKSEYVDDFEFTVTGSF